MSNPDERLDCLDEAMDEPECHWRKLGEHIYTPGCIVLYKSDRQRQDHYCKYCGKRIKVVR